MDIDAKIVRVKELIAKREELDAELQELLGGTVRERRSPKCSICGEPGHRASTCPSKQLDPDPTNIAEGVQRSGAIFAIPILSGLHHHYVRI